LSFELFPDTFSKKRQWWHRTINPKAQCERADVILTPSENTRRDIVELYDIDSSKIFVTYPGTLRTFILDQDQTLSVKSKYKLPDKFILFLGTVEPRKNIDGLIAAYKLSLLKHKKYELIIAGCKGWKSGGTMKAIEEVPGVRYVDYVDAADKPALYNLANLFVFPSLYEGFGIPVLEAFASGTPVITSNCSSLVEVAGDAAYLVDPNNASDIAVGMNRILGDRDLQQQFVARGREQSHKFAWQSSAKILYNTLV